MASGHSGGHAAHAHVHHLSPAPIVVALGALLLYAGFALGAGALGEGRFTTGVGVLVVGIVVFLAGMFTWIYEDIGLYRKNHNLVEPTGAGKPLGWWGMMLFLGTEITLFGTLFASFFVARDDVPTVWEAARTHVEHAVPLVTINTLILVTSGVTMHWGLHQIQKDKRGAFLAGMIVTLILGAIFLAVQVSEYAGLIAAGITLGGSQFGSIFYLLTGTHAFHVFLGLCFILVLIVRGFRGQFDSKRHVAVDAFTIYWHFVDIVWIGLYFVVYIGVI